MQLVRSLAAGAVVVGAMCGFSVAGTTAASAVSVQPVAGGVQVDLSHEDTVWASQSHVGAFVAGLPNPAAASFGRTLDTLAELASQYPQGHVAFTVFGPLDNLSGTMTALAY
jgi:hypothetical protein